MKEFAITADSNCDLPESLISKYRIGIIPHFYYLKDVTYGDEGESGPERIL
jgi:fatty acid-binding protein DegV